MRKILLLLLAVVFTLPCFAHRDHEMNRLNMSYFKGTDYIAIGNASAMWNVSNSGITGEITTLTYNGTEYPAFKYTGTTEVKLNLRHKNKSGSGGTTNDTGVYPYVNTEVMLKILVKSASGKTITPSFTFRKTKLQKFDENGKGVTDANGAKVTETATVTYDFSGTVPTDGVTVFTGYAPQYAKWTQSPANYKMNDTWFFRKSAYTDCNVILNGINEGDIVTVIEVLSGRHVGEQLGENGWITPKISLSNQAIRRVYNDSQKKTHEDQEFPVGTCFIQAEDFDEPTAERPTTHSSTKSNNNYADGYGYPSKIRDFDASCDNIRIDVVATDGGGVGSYSSWGPNGMTMTCVDKNTKDFALPNFAQQEWNAAYTGETNADGSADLNNLADFYGAWTEYTVYAAEHLFADISLRTGVHNTNYQAYKAGSAPSPIVSGEGENYMVKYGGAYRIFVDGKPVRSNWIVRPSANINDIHDFSTWESNMESQPALRSIPETSYFAYAVPNVSHGYGTTTCGHTWGSTYKSEIGDHLYANGAIDDEQKKVFSLPDFANIELTPGNHVIKVQAMGGRTSFDEIKVQAHSNPDTPTGIDLVQQLPGENFDANAPVEWYTLQGVRVENPSNGIFIRRQGSRAAKVALK